MRLVSAIYGDGYPFQHSGMFDAFFSTSDPDDLKEGDCLVVWGGGDIHPSLYNKERSIMSGAPKDGPGTRDRIEWELMHRAKELGCPIIGVCRGGQMACALAGGYLIQHIDGHTGWSHQVITNDKALFEVNTIHHQMMMPGNAPHTLLAWTPERLSKRYFDVDEQVMVPQENELIWFPEVKALAIQWHPEGLRENTEANKYVFQKMKELF